MEKIILRSLVHDDLDFLFDLENDKRYWHLSHTTEPFTKADLKNYIRNAQQPLSSALQKRYVVTDLANQRYGFIDFYDYNAEHHRAGVGILIHPQWQAKGIGKQALILLIEEAMTLAIHQLYAMIPPENKPSLALFEKCGFEKSGLKKEWYFYNKKFHDMWFYQKRLHV